MLIIKQDTNQIYFVQSFYLLQTAILFHVVEMDLFLILVILYIFLIVHFSNCFLLFTRFGKNPGDGVEFFHLPQ